MSTSLAPSNTRLTAIWLALVALTLLTAGIGESGMSGREPMLILLAIALFKGHMVATWFMGVRHAGFFWRAVMLVYLLLVGGLIAVATLSGYA